MTEPADQRVFHMAQPAALSGCTSCGRSPMPAPDAGERAVRETAKESTMTETMSADAGGSAEMLNDMLAEPESRDGFGQESIATSSGETGRDDAPEYGERTVPLATFLDMRDEAKANRAENAELRQMLAMMQQDGIPQREAEGPDPTTDPEGYAQYMAMLENQQAQMEAQQAYEHLGYVESSLDAAKDHLGDSFTEAYETARVNPQVARHILSHPNPGGALVEFHHQLQRQKIVERIPTGVSLDDWINHQAERLPRHWPGVAYQTPHIAAPPPSLAGARGGNASAMAHVISDDPVDDILK